MILWTSPPGPESEIGHYCDWTELLITHEETHLVHLLRPSRNPARQLARPAPPRWGRSRSARRAGCFEGYATVVEGRLTGSGRPNGDLRAAILRRWAQGGKLPSYARLASDSGSLARACRWPTCWAPPIWSGWRSGPVRGACASSGRG